MPARFLGDLAARHQLALLGPPVPKSVRFAEAPGLGRSIFEHAPDSPGASAYRAVAAEVALRLGLDAGLDR